LISWDNNLLNLMEGIGTLIGHMPSGSDKQTDYMAVLLTVPIKHLEFIVSNQLYKKDADENHSFMAQFCDLIMAIGTFSKGFPYSLQAENVNIKQFFATPLKLILDALCQLPTHPKLRLKAIFFYIEWLMLWEVGLWIFYHCLSIYSYKRAVELMISLNSFC